MLLGCEPSSPVTRTHSRAIKFLGKVKNLFTHLLSMEPNHLFPQQDLLKILISWPVDRLLRWCLENWIQGWIQPLTGSCCVTLGRLLTESLSLAVNYPYLSSLSQDAAAKPKRNLYSFKNSTFPVPCTGDKRPSQLQGYRKEEHQPRTPAQLGEHTGAWVIQGATGEWVTVYHEIAAIQKGKENNDTTPGKRMKSHWTEKPLSKCIF